MDKVKIEGNRRRGRLKKWMEVIREDAAEYV